MNKTYGYKFLKKIDFKNLGKWYVSYYINPFSLKSKYNFVKLKNIIKPYKNLIRKEDYKILKEFIDKSGESVNGFFLRVAKEAMNKDVQQNEALS